MEDTKKYAKDYKCISCGKQAEVWYPVIDPDIPCYPYCKECALKERNKLIIKLNNIDLNKKRNHESKKQKK